MKDKRLAIVGLLVTILLIGVIFAFYFATDRKGPVITVDTAKVKPYSASQGADVLKSYAKAVDQADGDVSDTIIVENIYVMSDMNSAKVIYAARDKKNNITKLNYMIEYIPSDEEIQAKNRLTNEETETESTNSESVTETTAASQTGTQDTKKQTEANTKSTKESEEATTQEGAPKLVLSATEATINSGTTFYISKYVESITDDTDSMSDLAKRILIKGNYDTKKAGDYTFEVYCTDSQKNESNHVKFNLHVK